MISKPHRRFLLLLVPTTAAAVLTGWLASKAIRQGPALPIGPDSFSLKGDSHSGARGVALENVQTTSTDRNRTGVPGDVSASVQESSHARIARLREKMMEYAAADGWDKTYAKYSAEELLREQDIVDQAIVEATWGEFDRRFEAGEFESVTTNGTYTPEHFNPYDVHQIRFLGNGVVSTASLPEAGFEDVYKLKAQSAWLFTKSRERLVQLTNR